MTSDLAAAAACSWPSQFSVYRFNFSIFGAEASTILQFLYLNLKVKILDVVCSLCLILSSSLCK